MNTWPLPLKWIALGLLLLLLALQFTLWAGQGGWPHVRQIRAQVQSQQAENESLQARNDALRADVSDLKQGTEAIEEHARGKLGMIKPDETFYQVIESESNPAAAADQAAATSATEHSP